MQSHENKKYLREDFSEEFFEHASFTDCIFENCVFSESDFRNARFSECVFKECNLHLVKLDGCRFQDVLFEESKIVGGEYCKCDKRFLFLQFKQSILLGCNFSGLKLKRTGFVGCKIKECYFNDTFLPEADFREADLEGSLFHQSDLSKADFRDAKKYSINPQSNTLKKTRFSSPEALSLLSFFDIQIS